MNIKEPTLLPTLLILSSCSSPEAEAIGRFCDIATEVQADDSVDVEARSTRLEERLAAEITEETLAAAIVQLKDIPAGARYQFIKTHAANTGIDFWSCRAADTLWRDLDKKREAGRRARTGLADGDGDVPEDAVPTTGDCPNLDIVGTSIEPSWVRLRKIKGRGLRNAKKLFKVLSSEAKPDLLECFNSQHPEAERNTPGNMALSLKITKGGKVKSAQVDGWTGKQPEALECCIRSRAKGWQLPKVGRSIQVESTLVYGPPTGKKTPTRRRFKGAKKRRLRADR